jgi:hypothetical protein
MRSHACCDRSRLACDISLPVAKRVFLGCHCVAVHPINSKTQISSMKAISTDDAQYRLVTPIAGMRWGCGTGVYIGGRTPPSYAPFQAWVWLHVIG